VHNVISDVFAKPMDNFSTHSMQEGHAGVPSARACHGPSDDIMEAIFVIAHARLVRSGLMRDTNNLLTNVLLSLVASAVQAYCM
jgi:hypothetical protein